MWWNGIKCKYMFTFLLKILARKELNNNACNQPTSHGYTVTMQRGHIRQTRIQNCSFTLSLDTVSVNLGECDIQNLKNVIWSEIAFNTYKIQHISVLTISALGTICSVPVVIRERTDTILGQYISTAVWNLLITSVDRKRALYNCYHCTISVW